LAVLFLLSPISADAQAIHDQRHPMPDDPRGIGSERPTQPGQAAFAAIQEIVAILEADPRTDWSKVNIDALRADRAHRSGARRRDSHNPRPRRSLSAQRALPLPIQAIAAATGRNSRRWNYSNRWPWPLLFNIGRTGYNL
jgi:hypothetical protein